MTGFLIGGSLRLAMLAVLVFMLCAGIAALAALS
jgi:hypothetical protein